MLRRRSEDDPDWVVKQIPDDHPPTHLTAPLRIDQLAAVWNADEGRAEFRVVVRDADDKRCGNIAVDASVTGPNRSATAQITTSIMGAALFRMADGPGAYAIEVLDIGAQGIDWDRDAGPTVASVES